MTTSFSLQAKENTILVFGDSLSAAYRMPKESGWVTLLAVKLKDTHPNWNVINHSQSGETTGGGVSRLPKLLDKHAPDILILELGGNDGLRGIPPFQIKRNLESMIRMAQKKNTKVLLVGMKLPPNYSDKYTQLFENLFHDLSEKYEIPLVPFLLDNIALNPELMMSDRIHPTAKAQPLILENVLPKLQTLLEQAPN